MKTFNLEQRNANEIDDVAQLSNIARYTTAMNARVVSHCNVSVKLVDTSF